MKVILYMAITADGFIATKEGNSDWVSENDPGFMQQIDEAGGIIVGRVTYEQYYDDPYPIEGVKNIVVTKDSAKKEQRKDVYYANSAKEAVELAEKLGLESVVLVGGGKLNAEFMKQNLIDEIYLVVHPLLLGRGIHVFESMEGFEIKKLGFRSVTNVAEDLIRVNYQVEH